MLTSKKSKDKSHALYESAFTVPLTDCLSLETDKVITLQRDLIKFSMSISYDALIKIFQSLFYKLLTHLVSYLFFFLLPPFHLERFIY